MSSAAELPVILTVWIALAACAGVQAPSTPPNPETPKKPPDLSAGPPAQATVVSPPSLRRAAEPAKTPSETGLPVIHYTVQAGAFSTLGPAADYAAKLRGAGVDAFYFVDSDHLFKVRFERFDTPDAAQQRAVEVQSRGLIEAFFIIEHARRNPPGDMLKDLRESIVQTARRFIGTSYRWGGISQRDGFDCSGLAMTVFRLNGLSLPRSTLGQYHAGIQVRRDALAPGDLVFFATRSSSRISHVGIYSGEDRFIHAPGQGKTIRTASLSNPYFEKRFKGARRYF